MSGIKKIFLYRRSISFSDTASEWLEIRRGTLKESSFVRYCNILKLHILPFFGDMPISSITREDVRRFSAKLLASDAPGRPGLSGKTVSAVLSVLKSILRYASQTKGIRMIDFDDIGAKAEKKELRVLNLDEQQKLVQCLIGRKSLSDLGILLALNTGMRVGELCALKWDCISLPEQSIYIRRTMQRLQNLDDSPDRTRINVTTPKSHCSIRTIPIPDHLMAFIKEIKADENCYFLTGKEDEYIEPRTMENRFKAVCGKCGINGATFHTLRHTFATNCIELGFDLKCLSEILGHASVTITMDRYVHPSKGFKQTNMNLLSSLYEKNISQNKTLCE